MHAWNGCKRRFNDHSLKVWVSQVHQYILKFDSTVSYDDCEHAAYRVRIMLSNLRDFKRSQLRSGKRIPQRFQSLQVLLDKVVLKTEPEDSDVKPEDSDVQPDDSDVKPDDSDVVAVLSSESDGEGDDDMDELHRCLFQDSPKKPAPQSPPKPTLTINIDEPSPTKQAEVPEEIRRLCAGNSEVLDPRQAWKKDKGAKRRRITTKASESAPAAAPQGADASKESEQVAAVLGVFKENDTKHKFASRAYHRALSAAKRAGCSAELAKQRAREAHQKASDAWQHRFQG